MFLEESQMSRLKEYLISSLEAISDADNEALSEYIIALIRNDKPLLQIKKECQEQLEEFLESNTMDFVSKLFDWLEKIDKPTSETSPEKKGFGISQDELENEPKRQKQDTLLSSTNEKLKDAKLDSQSNSIDKSNGRFSSPRKSNPQQSRQNMQRCPDYEEKGFCTRAENCPFPHGADAIAMDDINLFNKKVREPSNSGSIDHSQQSAQDDYDPSNPYVGSHHRGYSRGSHSYRGHRGGFQNNRARGNSHYSGFNSYSTRENHTVSRTILSLENIPSEKYSQGAIKEYFERFGEVASVTVDRHQPKAEVEFKTEESALKANTSPEPIFGNRFVKLYWKRIPIAYTPTSQEHRPTPGAFKPDTELVRKQRLLHKKKTELVSKQLEEQKKLLALVENPSLSETDRKSILASLSNVTKLITETLASLTKSTALQKSDAMETGDSDKPIPAPTAVKKPILRGGFGANKWVPGMTTHSQYHLDNRPKAFKITGFEAGKRDLVESHLKSIRGIDDVKLDADNVTFQIECKNHYLAKRAQAEALKMGDVTFRTSWVASSPQPNSVASDSAPVTNQ